MEIINAELECACILQDLMENLSKLPHLQEYCIRPHFDIDTYINSLQDPNQIFQPDRRILSDEHRLKFIQTAIKTAVRFCHQANVIIQAASRRITQPFVAPQQMFYRCNEMARIVLSAENDHSHRLLMEHKPVPTQKVIQGLVNKKYQALEHLENYCHSPNPDVGELITRHADCDCYLNGTRFPVHTKEHVIKFLQFVVKLCQRFPVDTERIIANACDRLPHIRNGWVQWNDFAGRVNNIR